MTLLAAGSQATPPEFPGLMFLDLTRVPRLINLPRLYNRCRIHDAVKRRLK